MIRSKLEKGKIVSGFIVGKEIIDNNVYACVAIKDGKILVQEKQLHELDVRDKVGVLLGASINVLVEEYNDFLGCFIGSRIKANEIEKDKLTNKDIGHILNANVIIVSKNNCIVNVCGMDIRIKAKELKRGWIEDLRDVIKIGEKIRVILTNINPIEIEVIKKVTYFDVSRYKVGSEYVGIVIGTPEFGIIVELENVRQVLCYKVEWKDEPKIGETVVVQISEIKEQEEKTYGYIKRRIRR